MSTARSQRRGIITPHTGLRGFAALCVMMTHLGSEERITLHFPQSRLLFFHWSDYAVDLFFMLSGFILYWVYFRDGERIDWKSYLQARCARILPLYYLTMLPFLPPTIRTFQSHGLLAQQGTVLKKLLLNVFMISGFGGVDRWDWRYNAASWSVCVEMFAYVILIPVLVRLLGRFGMKAMYWVFSICCVGMLLCYGNFPHRLWGWDWGQFGRGLFCFPAGFALCSILLTIPSAEDRRIGPAVSLGAVVIVELAVFNILPRQMMLAAFPFLILGTAMNMGIICRILNTPAFQWLGERSYSIYLWHTPIMYVWFLPHMGKVAHGFHSNHGKGLANMAIILFGTFLISELSYRLFENPIRNLVAAHRRRVRMIGQP